MKRVAGHIKTLASKGALTLLAVILAAAMTLTVLPSCTRTGKTADSWTVCIYLCGSNLESKQSWATKTLDEIAKVHLPSNVTLVVQVGGAKEWHSEYVSGNGARLAYTLHGFKEVGSAGDVCMGDASTLTDFLNFCEDEYASEHTAVVLWDHGGGPIKGVCYDETDHFDALSLSDLEEAFAACVEKRNGTPYELVGFDACLMASLETADALSGKANYLVASEDIESGAGWDYGAFFRTLRQNPPTEDVAATICDGYIAKCTERGKEDSATLSVIDLSKIPAVESALEATITELQQKDDDGTKTLRHLVNGARYAESFGGDSDKEGRSNLIDLKDMALEHVQDPDDDEQSWKALVDAIEQAVTYHANGVSKREAFGLSIWYPLSFKEKDLDAYAKASPLTSYVAALEHAYKTRMDPVEFSDPGSINDAGRFSITISPESKEEFFDLYIENSAVDGSYADTNGDMKGSWEILSFSYPPEEAVAITLNGMVLDAELISYDESYELFSCPVVIDDEDMYLRILWTWNYEEPGNGHYDLVGVWNGVDHTSGMAGRSDIELVPGSIVEARRLSDDSIRGQVKIGDTIEISEQPLPPGTYKSRFVAMDLRGNEYPSSTYTYKIDEQGNTQNISIG